MQHLDFENLNICHTCCQSEREKLADRSMNNFLHYPKLIHIFITSEHVCKIFWHNLHFNFPLNQDICRKIRGSCFTPNSPLTSRQWSSWMDRGCVCCRRTVSQVQACVHSPWAPRLPAPPRLLPGCRAPSFQPSQSSHSSPSISATLRPTICTGRGHKRYKDFQFNGIVVMVNESTLLPCKCIHAPFDGFVRRVH